VSTEARGSWGRRGERAVPIASKTKPPVVRYSIACL